jgi:hypothetical protein
MEFQGENNMHAHGGSFGILIIAAVFFFIFVSAIGREGKN